MSRRDKGGEATPLVPAAPPLTVGRAFWLESRFRDRVGRGSAALRVTSDLWVHAFMRRERARGAFCAVLAKGAAEAGAIFIVENRLEEGFNLYAPAPQSLVAEDGDGERAFERVIAAGDQARVDEYLEKQRRFDADVWIVETEHRSGAPSLTLVGD